LAEGEEYCPKCGQTLVAVEPPSAPPPRLYPENEVLSLRREVLRLIDESKGMVPASMLAAAREKIANLESKVADLKCELQMGAVCPICQRHPRPMDRKTAHVPIYPDPGYSLER
jgi:hypothetical protein